MTKRGTRTPSGMGSITYTLRDGKKYWTGRVTIGFDKDGNQIRRSYSGFKRTDVVEKMQRALATQNVSGYVDKGDATLRNTMHHWLFQVKAKEIKTTTLARYDTIYRLRIKDHSYAKIKIRDITIRNLQDYIDSLISPECTRNMAKGTLSLLKVFLDHTITIGMLQTNPAKFVRLPRRQDPPRDNEKYRIFTREEEERILQAIDPEDPVEAMLYLDFLTGLRRSEIRGLQWKNIRDGRLYVEQQLRRQYTFEGDTRTLDKDVLSDLKTETSRRTLPLPAIAQDFLHDQRLKCMEKHMRTGKTFTEDAYIFSDQECEPIEEKRPNRRLQFICKKLGIKPRPLHAIRHSYATRLFEEGIDIKTVQHLMGHADYKTTLDIYTHVMPEKKEKAVSVFDRLYG